MRASEECWFGPNALTRSVSEPLSSSKGNARGPVKLVLSPSKHHYKSSVNQLATFDKEAKSLEPTAFTEPVTPCIIYSKSNTIDSKTMIGDREARSYGESGRQKARALSKKRRFMNAEKLGTFACSAETPIKYFKMDCHGGSSCKSEDSKRPGSRDSDLSSEDDSKKVPSTINIPGSNEEELSQIDNLSHAQTEDGDDLEKKGHQPEVSEFSLLFQGQSSVQRERAMRLLNWNCSSSRKTEKTDQPSSSYSFSGANESFSHLFGNEPELERKAESLLTWEYKAPKPPKPVILKPSASLRRPRDIRSVSPDHSARTDARKQLDAAKTLLDLPNLDKKEKTHKNSMSPPPMRPRPDKSSPFSGVTAAIGQTSQPEIPPHVFNAMTRMHLASLQRQKQLPSPLLFDAYLRWSNQFR